MRFRRENGFKVPRSKFKVGAEMQNFEAGT
jgi:hypothetical protein